MASDSDSGDEVFSTDCGTSGTDGGRRKRRASVTDSVRRVEGRKAKRPAPGRGSTSPGAAGHAAPPGAVRPAAVPPGGLNADSLNAIQHMIETGISKVISAFEAKFDHLERRITVLESEGMDRECEMKRLSEQLETQVKTNNDLQTQIESIDLNGRMSSLILTCSDFEKTVPKRRHGTKSCRSSQQAIW